MTIVAGIDGCRGGWLCVSKAPNDASVSVRVLSRFDEIASLEPLPRVIAVDMPIGLPESGPRECDLEARRLLTRLRASSVFPAPIRPILAASSREHASSIRRSIDGKGVTIQSWSLVAKVNEVDALIQSRSSKNIEIYEVHPELSFWAWNGKQPMAHPKRTLEGRMERERLVENHYGNSYRRARVMPARACYASNDLLDAFAALWTAERVYAGQAMTLPAAPPTDAYGIPMRMLA